MSLRSRIAVLVLSVVVGVAGAVLVLIWADRRAGAEVAAAMDDLGIREVLVASAVVEAGTTLDEARRSGSVEFREVMTPPEDALDEILPRDLDLEFAHRTYPGDVVTGSRLVDEATSAPFAQEEGGAAVTVTLGEAARGTAFLSAGARVAVLVTGLAAEVGEPGTRTCVLVPALEVLAVGGRAADTATTDDGTGGPGVGDVPDQLVTVDVDPESAVRLVQGDADGDLYFVRLGDGESPFARGDCRTSADLLT
jgi:Flp pilus assembly protein CpaB